MRAASRRAASRRAGIIRILSGRGKETITNLIYFQIKAGFAVFPFSFVARTFSKRILSFVVAIPSAMLFYCCAVTTVMLQLLRPPKAPKMTKISQFRHYPQGA